MRLIYLHISLIVALCSCSFDGGGLTLGDGSVPLSDGYVSVSDTPSPLSDGSDQTTWFDEKWPYRIPLLVTGTSSDEALADFPVMIPFEGNTSISEHATSIVDFRVTDDAGTLLSHEIESCNIGTGSMVLWVKLPELPTTDNTKLWLYYGNDDPSFAPARNGVWSAGYEAVWHLDDDPKKSRIDDSTERHHGTTRGDMDEDAITSGRIGGALTFDGADDAIDVGVFDIIADGPGNDGTTLEAWFSFEDTDYAQRILSKATGMELSQHFWALDVRDWGAPRFRLRLNTYTYEMQANGVKAKTWHHIAATYDAEAMRIYIDGNLLRPPGPQNASGTIAKASKAKVSIGAQPPGAGDSDNGRNFKGQLDEIRVSRVARSAAWIATQYANQTAPDTFVQIGDAQRFDVASQ